MNSSITAANRDVWDYAIEDVEVLLEAWRVCLGFNAGYLSLQILSAWRHAERFGLPRPDSTAYDQLHQTVTEQARELTSQFLQYPVTKTLTATVECLVSEANGAARIALGEDEFDLREGQVIDAIELIDDIRLASFAVLDLIEKKRVEDPRREVSKQCRGNLRQVLEAERQLLRWGQFPESVAQHFARMLAGYDPEKVAGDRNFKHFRQMLVNQVCQRRLRESQSMPATMSTADLPFVTVAKELATMLKNSWLELGDWFAAAAPTVRPSLLVLGANTESLAVVPRNAGEWRNAALPDGILTWCLRREATGVMLSARWRPAIADDKLPDTLTVEIQQAGKSIRERRQGKQLDSEMSWTIPVPNELDLEQPFQIRFQLTPPTTK